MYTSGTTGDPKGVLISNESILTLIAGVNRLLESMNEQVSNINVLTLFIVRLPQIQRVASLIFFNIINGVLFSKDLRCI